MSEDAYYFEPVRWAVFFDITNGTSKTTFSPDKVCARAEIVTFLWRTFGCPEPETTINPFKDVKSSDYYYKAVLRAVENYITNGVTYTRFDPNAKCTRAQAVTFLRKADGKPGSSTGFSVYEDVQPGSYYYSAALWAVDRKITKDTSLLTFSPDAYRSRGEIVTFLYRDYFMKITR